MNPCKDNLGHTLSDEVFHFYAGDPVEMLQLLPDRSGRVVVIGNDLASGHEPQVIVPAGVSATRYSPLLTSRATPTCMGRSLGTRPPSPARPAPSDDQVEGMDNIEAILRKHGIQ